MELSPRAKIKQDFHVLTATLEPFTYLNIYTHALPPCHACEPLGYLISMKAYCDSQFEHSSAGKMTRSPDGSSSSLSLLLFKIC